MRYLGLDLGSRTLGVAVSDKTGMIASSYKTIRHNEDYDELLYEDVEENSRSAKGRDILPNIRVLDKSGKSAAASKKKRANSLIWDSL